MENYKEHYFMTKRLFINEELRSLQVKLKNTKASENIAANGNNLPIHRFKPGIKMSEKLVAETNGGKKPTFKPGIKWTEKLVAETKGDNKPKFDDIWIKGNSDNNNDDRLF